MIEQFLEKADGLDDHSRLRIREMSIIDAMGPQYQKALGEAISGLTRGEIVDFINKALQTKAGPLGWQRYGRKNLEYTRTIVFLMAGILAFTHKKTSDGDRAIEWSAGKDLIKQGQSLYKHSTNFSISKNLKEQADKLALEFKKLVDSSITEEKNYKIRMQAELENAAQAIIMAQRLRANLARSAEEARIRADAEKNKREEWEARKRSNRNLRILKQKLMNLGKEVNIHHKSLADLENNVVNQELSKLTAIEKGMVGNSRSEINTRFLQQCISMQNIIVPLITEIEEEFQECVAKCNKKIEDREAFRKNLAKNLFSAVKKYAPPPINLIGLAAGTLLEGAKKLNSIYDDFSESVGTDPVLQEWGVATQAKDTADNLKNTAYTEAKEKLSLAKNWAVGDVGVSAFNAANLKLEDQFRAASETSFKTLTTNLEKINSEINIEKMIENFNKDGRALTGLSEDKGAMRARFSPHLERKYALAIEQPNSPAKTLRNKALWDGTVSSTPLFGTGRDLIEQKLNPGHRSEEELDFRTKTRERLSKYFHENLKAHRQDLATTIIVPNWTVNTSDESLASLKRFLTLYLLGMYLHGEITKEGGASESKMIFELEQPLRHLLQKEKGDIGWTHERKKGAEMAANIAIGDRAPVSVPYHHSSTGKIYESNHKGDFLLLNCIARQYAFSAFTPAVILMDENKSWEDAENHVRFIARNISGKIEKVRDKRTYEDKASNLQYRNISKGVTDLIDKGNSRDDA